MNGLKRYALLFALAALLFVSTTAMAQVGVLPSPPFAVLNDGNLGGNIYRLWQPEDELPQHVVNQLRIVEQLLEMQELEVLNEGFSAEVRVNVNAGVLNNKWHAATHSVEGRVVAGIPTHKILPSSVIYDSVHKTYTIVLPAAQLLDCRITNVDQDEESRSPSVHSIDWDILRPLARQQGREELANQAMKEGMLWRAEYQTAYIVETMIAAFTAERSQVAFLRDPSDSSFAESCVANAPPGFKRDGQDSWSWR
ncbi:MAG: DUF4230 domain-containing protein [Chloroflexi bacterium]|nr:DUF4230 domain-containing protein [Chloroflexota bacterium]